MEPVEEIHKELTIYIIAIMMNLKSSRTLSAKAKRQQWPYVQRIHAGSPMHLYNLGTLPDDIQIAWASWDETKYQNSIKCELEKGSLGRPHQIPLVENYETILQVLKWPQRVTYYVPMNQTAGATKKGAPSKIYDGTSVGLCDSARKILNERLPGLRNQNSIYPDVSITDHPATTRVSPSFIEEEPEKYEPLTGNKLDNLYKQLKEKEESIQLLTSEIQELKRDKSFLKTLNQDLQFEKEKLIEEKEKRILDKDKLISFLEESIRDLKFKLEINKQ